MPIFKPRTLRISVGIRMNLGAFSSSLSPLSLLALFKIFFRPKIGRTFFINPKRRKRGFIVSFFSCLKNIKNSFSTKALFPLTIKRLIILDAQKELNK
jgi:hypothetical protein